MAKVATSAAAMLLAVNAVSDGIVVSRLRAHRFTFRKSGFSSQWAPTDGQEIARGFRVIKNTVPAHTQVDLEDRYVEYLDRLNRPEERVNLVKDLSRLGIELGIDRSEMPKPKKALGEVDYEHHQKVVIPIEGKVRKGKPQNSVLVVVEIKSGNKQKGSGVLIEDPNVQGLKFGDSISFEMLPEGATPVKGSEYYPVLKKIQHKKNAAEALKLQLAESIKSSILSNQIRA